MHGMLSRKDRQLEKMELAASRGLNYVVLQLYSSEAKRWSKKGFQVKKNDDEKKFGIYTLTFDFPSLLNSAEVNKFIGGCKALPANITCAQRLYLIAQKAIFEESFTD